MRFFLLFIILIFSLSLMSQTSKEAAVNNVNIEEDEGYYSDEDRDPIYIDQKEEQQEVARSDCNCDTVQAQEEPPIYVIMPPPAQVVPQQQVAPTIPQVGPDLYKQFQSGNYQYQSFEPMNQPTNQ